MSKYRVFGIISASKVMGEYEADSPEKAIERAEEDSKADRCPILCYQCAQKVDLGEVYKMEAELMEE